MIEYNPKAWVSLITHQYSRQVMKTLQPVMIFQIVYTGIICFIMITLLKLDESKFHSTISMHSLLGVVLGLFLVFRTNSAYDRWWEGRKLWGSMVNNTRNLAHKLGAFLSSGDSCWVSAKFSRAAARCCGLSATHSVMRLCSLACSAAGSLG